MGLQKYATHGASQRQQHTARPETISLTQQYHIPYCHDLCESLPLGEDFPGQFFLLFWGTTVLRGCFLQLLDRVSPKPFVLLRTTVRAGVFPLGVPLQGGQYGSLFDLHMMNSWSGSVQYSHGIALCPEKCLQLSGVLCGVAETGR